MLQGMEGKPYIPYADENDFASLPAKYVWFNYFVCLLSRKYYYGFSILAYSLFNSLLFSSSNENKKEWLFYPRPQKQLSSFPELSVIKCPDVLSLRAMSMTFI